MIKVYCEILEIATFFKLLEKAISLYSKLLKILWQTFRIFLYWKFSFQFYCEIFNLIIVLRSIFSHLFIAIIELFHKHKMRESTIICFLNISKILITYSWNFQLKKCFSSLFMVAISVQYQQFSFLCWYRK